MNRIKPMSIINFLSIFIPWTILPLRQNEFALESPNAEIIIGLYCIYILAAFFFSLHLYTKKKLRDTLSSIALIVNGIYAAGVVGIICVNIPNWTK